MAQGLGAKVGRAGTTYSARLNACAAEEESLAIVEKEGQEAIAGLKGEVH